MHQVRGIFDRSSMIRDGSYLLQDGTLHPGCPEACFPKLRWAGYLWAGVATTTLLGLAFYAGRASKR